jgi:hypothetical protein
MRWLVELSACRFELSQAALVHANQLSSNAAAAFRLARQSSSCIEGTFRLAYDLVYHPYVSCT